jgi:hypothetical protein
MPALTLNSTPIFPISGGRFRRIAGHAGVLRATPRLDLILADSGRLDEQHLRGVGDARVRSGRVVVVTERRLQPRAV